MINSILKALLTVSMLSDFVIMKDHNQVKAAYSSETMVSIESIRLCLEKKLSEKNFKKSKDRPFFVSNGALGIEGLGTFSTYEMKSIEYFLNCSLPAVSNSFENRLSEPHDNFHGGSNITFVTSEFQQVLPSILSEILSTVELAMKKAEWGIDSTSLGVKTIFFTNFEKEGLEQHRQELKRLAQNNKEKASFVVYPKGQLEEMQRQKELLLSDEFDPDADSAVSHLLQRRKDVLLTVVVSLRARSEYAGGEFLVRRTSAGETQTEENEYDDEEEEEVSGEEGPEEADEGSREEGTGGQKFPRYHVKHASVGRLTPDKGGVLLIRGDHEYGNKPIKAGRRTTLVIEFRQIHKDQEL